MAVKRGYPILISACVTVMVLFATGCGPEEKKESTDGAPTLPPESSMVMDYSAFTTASARLMGKSLDSGSEILLHNFSDPQSNFKQAALQVGVWNLLIGLNMVIPVAAFREAFNHLPSLQSDGTWIWTYNVTVQNATYVASLHGKVVDSNVNWAMYVTKETVYENYLWFSGVSALDRSGGTWSVNRSVADATPTPFIDIVWHKDDTAGTLDLRFTDVIPDDAGNGTYVEYAVTGLSPYDSYYHIFNVELSNNLTEIEWNSTSKAGRITNLNHYLDTNWYYWDEGQNDITTP